MEWVIRAVLPSGLRAYRSTAAVAFGPSSRSHHEHARKTSNRPSASVSAERIHRGALTCKPSHKPCNAS